MKESFESQLNKTVENKIKSSASIPTTPQKDIQGLLTLDQIKSMSREDIARNKELVNKSLDAIWGK